MNKPHGNRTYAERLANVSSPRPVIDLERPAEEHMEIDVEEVKPVVRGTLLQTVGNLHPWHPSQPALQHSSPLAGSAEFRSISRLGESLGSTGRSLDNCFTAELSKHKEVPSLSRGPTKFGDSEAYACHARASPVTSLFGVKLNQENASLEKQMQAGQTNQDEKRKEPQSFSTDACRRSTGEPSKLPHWLLKGPVSISVKTSPVKPDPQNLLREYQNLSSVLQRHDERKVESMFYDRVNGGTRLHFGEIFVREPQGKPLSGYCLDASRENVQGFHKLAQISSSTESMPFFLRARDERGAGGLQAPAAGYTYSPTINQKSPVFDIQAAPAALLQNLGSKGECNGASMPLWYQQQKDSFSLMPQVSKTAKRSPNAFSVDSLSAWANSSVREDVQTSMFTRNTIDSSGEKERDSEICLLSFAKTPKVSSKRLIFGFMPTASDLELTLGLDLNADKASETLKSVDDSSKAGNITRRDSKIDLESRLIRNDFDLNVQSSQVLDACCLVESHAVPTRSEQVCETEISHGWQTPFGGKATYCEERHTLHSSSDITNKPEVAITSTLNPLWSVKSSFPKVDTHREAPLAETPGVTIVNGGMFVAGTGLMSGESRSMSIPMLPKAQDDSITSGELCQSSEVKVSMQNEGGYSLNSPSKSAMEKVFGEPSVMVGRQQGIFPAMLGCSHVSQPDTTEDLLMAKCTGIDTNKAFVNNADKDATEAFEAADVLLHLGLDLQGVGSEDRGADDQERALKWLADIIPQEELTGRGAAMGDYAVRESPLRGSGPPLDPLESVGVQERELDSFELSVLRLEKINPDTENFCTPPIERCDLTEDCSPHPNLRRRSQRRGRVGKDFQKEMLPSIASLSRQEITEDLQIIEGLVKSATEAMARCSLSLKEEVCWPLPNLTSVKTSCKAKGSRSCKAVKQNELLRVCSWGESTRRRRMRRQRSQWMCLPPGV